MNDEECAILEAVAKKEISPIRHASYKELYTTLKGKKKYD